MVWLRVTSDITYSLRKWEKSTLQVVLKHNTIFKSLYFQHFSQADSVRLKTALNSLQRLPLSSGVYFSTRCIWADLGACFDHKNVQKWHYTTSQEGLKSLWGFLSPLLAAPRPPPRPPCAEACASLFEDKGSHGERPADSQHQPSELWVMKSGLPSQPSHQITAVT